MELARWRSEIHRIPILWMQVAGLAQTHGLKLVAHALGGGSDSLYPQIIESAADMVNLEKAESVIELLKIESSKSKG